MPAKRLIEVDLKIANLRDEIARGHGSETAQVELTGLLAERAKLIEAMVGEPPRKDIDLSN